jgi:hypothetical protein
MRFREVLKQYYRIHLTQVRADTVDALFTLAAHSLRRLEEARPLRLKPHIKYHSEIFARAFHEMLQEISRFGDFINPCGPIPEGLGCAEG